MRVYLLISKSFSLLDCTHKFGDVKTCTVCIWRDSGRSSPCLHTQPCTGLTSEPRSLAGMSRPFDNSLVVGCGKFCVSLNLPPLGANFLHFLLTAAVYKGSRREVLGVHTPCRTGAAWFPGRDAWLLWKP